MKHSEAIQELHRRLSIDIAKRVSSEVGRWDGAADIVDGPSIEYELRLIAWEDDPADERREEVRRAYRGVLAAWDEAVAAYEASRRAER